jgi:ATP-dependent DNA ligase
MARRIARQPRTDAAALPQWIPPQLTQLVDAAPEGPDWLHEIKYDGYRMHARLNRRAVRLLTRAGLDWTQWRQSVAGSPNGSVTMTWRASASRTAGITATR